MAKKIIKLTEADLRNMVKEAAKVALNEVSPEFMASAYKKASDAAYQSDSPMEKSHRARQADDFRDYTIKKYNKKFGTMPTQAEDGSRDYSNTHKLQSIYYAPRTGKAHATTSTFGNDGNTNMAVTYTDENPEGAIDGDQRGGLYHPKPSMASRATKGERTIRDTMRNLVSQNARMGRYSESVVRLSEDELHKVISESVKRVLKEGMEWLGNFNRDNIGQLKEILETKNGGSFNLNGVDFTITPTQRGYQASSGTDWGYDALRIYDALRACWQQSFHANNR